jgi:hypothetical protein
MKTIGDFKMLKKTIALAMFCAMLALFAGCSGTGGIHQETLLDQNWGRSVEIAKYNQILNPEAGKNLTPVEGLSGKAAENSLEIYEKSFKKEWKEPETTTQTAISK